MPTKLIIQSRKLPLSFADFKLFCNKVQSFGPMDNDTINIVHKHTKKDYINDWDMVLEIVMEIEE